MAAASMRPARKGPENRNRWGAKRKEANSFNEAGPQGAGKPTAAGCWETVRGVGFNEAGPQGAGKPPPPPATLIPLYTASMRPARKGPENPLTAP